MESWVWFLLGLMAGILIAWCIMEARVKLWRTSSRAWEDSATMLNDEVKELQDELRPPR